MFRMIHFVLSNMWKSILLKCGRIEWWDFRLKFFFFLVIIHIIPLTMNIYHF